jgi:hypothetical protein
MNSRSRDYRKNHRAIPKQQKETPQEIGTEKHQNTAYHSLSGRNHILKDPKFKGKTKRQIENYIQGIIITISSDRNPR